jgi:hypothetical protein
MIGKCRVQIVQAIVLLTAANLTAAAVPANSTQHPMRREYLKKTYGVRAIGPVAGRAALNRGKGSYGDHLATSLEGHVVKNSVAYVVAGVRHEDLHYHRSQQKGFGPRLRHAMVSTVMTRKTTNGKRTVATGKLSGTAVAAVVAGGAATGGISIAADAGTNVAREFWPAKHLRNSPRR